MKAVNHFLKHVRKIETRLTSRLNCTRLTWLQINSTRGVAGVDEENISIVNRFVILQLSDRRKLVIPNILVGELQENDERENRQQNQKMKSEDLKPKHRDDD